MNFKMALFLCYCFFLLGCGVKARPLSPPDTAIQSYVQSYTGTPVELKKEKTDDSSAAKKK